MENKEKQCNAENVCLHNTEDLIENISNDIKDSKDSKYKVNFHSELVNEIVGDLDITV